MDPSVTIGLLAVLGALLAAAAGALIARRLRDRYRHLLAAIEDVARQVAELRRAVDGLHARVQAVDEHLAAVAASLEPQVARLGRALEIEQAGERVRAAELNGRLAPEAARSLLRHLADLAELVAVSRRR